MIPINKHFADADSSKSGYEEKQLEQEFLRIASWYEGAMEEGISILLEAKHSLENASGYPHTMIRSLSSRLKTPKSIIEKMKRFNFELTFESMQNNLQDIAGLRIVCSYIYDIYALRRWLLSKTNLSLIVAKDYISSPKPSGYRSLHLIFNVPVTRGDETKLIPLEMQIRTTAMDSWASLEHQLRYKANLIRDDQIHQELKECASLLYQSDLRMQKIFVKLFLQEDDEESQSNPKQDHLEFSGHRLITSQQQDSAAFDRIVALAMDQNKEQS